MAFSFHGREVCQDLVIARNPQFITCSVIGHLTVDNGGPVVRVFHRGQAIGSSWSHGEVSPLLEDKKLAQWPL